MTIASWSVNELDRLGRSVKEVLTIADELYEHRIGLRILTRHARRHVHPDRLPAGPSCTTGSRLANRREAAGDIRTGRCIVVVGQAAVPRRSCHRAL